MKYEAEAHFKELGVKSERRDQRTPPLLLREIGPVIKVRVGRLEDEEGEMGQDAIEVIAMIDTGAVQTGIEAGLAARLNLVSRGTQPMVGAGGRGGDRAQWLLGLDLIDFDLQCPVHAIDLDLEVSERFRVLIGRDVLQAFTLTYDGIRGEYELTRPS